MSKEEAVTEIDYVRSKKDTAKALNMSVRTLDRLEQIGQGPRRTNITQRIIGYRDFEIKKYQDARTA